MRQAAQGSLKHQVPAASGMGNAEQICPREQAPMPEHLARGRVAS